MQDYNQHIKKDITGDIFNDIIKARKQQIESANRPKTTVINMSDDPKFVKKRLPLIQMLTQLDTAE
jgi:hypothetical protein